METGDCPTAGQLAQPLADQPSLPPPVPSALPSSSSDLQLGFHNSAPVTESPKIQVMSPRGNPITEIEIFRNFESSTPKSPVQNLRPADVRVPTSPPKPRRDLSVIQPVITYHQSVTVQNFPRRGERSTSPGSPSRDAKLPISIPPEMARLRAMPSLQSVDDVRPSPRSDGPLVAYWSNLDPEIVSRGNRNVRRRLSPTTDITMREQFDTPQKVAYRAELHAQQDVIERLRARVQDVQGLAYTELETQQRSFRKCGDALRSRRKSQ